MEQSRRGFLGALMAAGGAVALTGSGAASAATVTRKLIIPSGDPELVEAITSVPDGEIIVAGQAEIEQFDLRNAFTDTWFGVPQYYLQRMDRNMYDEWLCAHVAVNERRGFTRTRFQNDGEANHMGNEQFRATMPGGTYF